MSLLTKFVRTHLLEAVEEEFMDALPVAKEAMIKELHDFACEVLKWTESKITNIGDGEHE